MGVGSVSDSRSQMQMSPVTPYKARSTAQALQGKAKSFRIP